MNLTIRALKTERIKSKRTLALYLSLLGPVVAVALSLFSLSMVQGHASAAGLALWAAYLRPTLILWFAFVFPIVVTIQTAQSAQLEHSNCKLKHLLSLPVSRSAVFFGKLAWLILLALVANVFLFAALIVVCGGAGLIHWSDRTLAEAAAYLAIQGGGAFVSSLPLVAIQFIVGMRATNFVAPVSVGFVGTLVGVLVGAQAPLAMSFFPWAMGSVFLGGRGVAPAIIVFVAVGATAVVSALGAKEFSRRQVQD